MDRRAAVRALATKGQTVAQIARATALPPSTVRRWVAGLSATDLCPPPHCPLCDGATISAVAYAYLLGQYLGDGHLVTSSRRSVLRIYACSDHPDIVVEIVDSILALRGSKPATMRTAGSARCTKIQSYWKHWPCLFPQHGAGPKHQRPITLTQWQRAIVEEHPWPLVRGLIHSDGCRAINRVVVRGVPYEYPRYFFSNESNDILMIMGDALDAVGVAWRYNRPNCISIARRAAVELMDAYIGPKT